MVMTTTLIKPNPCVLDVRAINDLIREAKRTSCYKIANYATAVLLGQEDKQLSWERKEDKLSNWNTDNWKETFHKDLVVVTIAGIGVCIPATKLNETVAKECYTKAIQQNTVVPKFQHKRKKKLCLPRQREYLMRKLESLCPDWRNFVKDNLKEGSWYKI